MTVIKSRTISRFVHFNTSAVIIERGEDLLEREAIKKVEYDERYDAWSFKVQGSELYDVVISGLSMQRIHTQCNCPFNWGNLLCKHKVAALLFLDGNAYKERIPEENNDFTKDGFRLIELKDYKLINNDFVVRNMSHLFFREGEFPNYGIIDINKSKIVFEIEKGFSIETVTIEKFTNKVCIYSTEGYSNNSLTDCMITCLRLIAETKMPNMLDILFSDKLMEKQSDTLKMYGLPEDVNFDDHFILMFDEELGLVFMPLDEGLIPINEDIELSLVPTNVSVESLFKSLNLSDRKEEMQMGFVFKKKIYYYDYVDDDVLQIIPIVGKVNKNGTALKSNFIEYSKFKGYDLVLSKAQKRLVEIVEELDKTTDDDRFSLISEAVVLLSKEKFVYELAEDAYAIKKNSIIPVKVSEKTISISFGVKETNRFISAYMLFFIDGLEIDAFDYNFIDYQNTIMHKIFGIYHTFKDEKTLKAFKDYEGEIKMVKDHKKEFFDHVVAPLSKNFNIVFEDEAFDYEAISLDFNKKQVFLSEMDEFLIIKPQVIYDKDTEVALFNSGNVFIREDDKIVEYKRNFELEEDFINLIAQLHPNFETQKSRKFFYLHYKEFTKDLWFYEFFDYLQTNEIEVFGLKKLKKFRYSPYKGIVSTSIASGQNWFEVGVQINFGDHSVSLKDIRKAVINRQKYIELKDGSVGVLPEEWLKKLQKYFRNGEIRNNKLKISKLRFSIIDELFDEIDDLKVVEEITEKRRRLRNFTEISKVSVPEQITANLRPYQKEGLNWLNFLEEMGWGGILADDMGLGKTLQILTFLQHITKKNKKPNLIVVPTTLMFNWENEIRKFAPKLKVFYHYGHKRLRETEHFNKYQIIFTTYGVLMRDVEFLRKFKFNYMVLDESQAIKNPSSRRYKSSVLINAKNKLALTGTPIENSTFDLFAQMNFVNPGFFGSISSFRDNYSNPIDKEGDEAMAVELHRIANPFILRRTKEKVAKELPHKSENVIYCEMEMEQRRVYEAYRNNYRDKLMNKISEDGLGKSKFMVLEALTRLRQICDSPALLNDDEIAVNQSIKIKEIVRHITEKTANHKILIFSQFVTMLGLIKDKLDMLNIDYEYLDGQRNSKQREASVNNFQQNDELRVFLISLKAGGMGLNLTSADYVYLIDPWWNPAVENQAIDRCHRIGQDKSVFAYRMICKDTVEEKILNLQAKKKLIASNIIQVDENIMKTIDKDDIVELFS